MAFILGVLPRTSDTSIPIWTKLLGCIELTLMHRHIFDFRFQPQTGSELFFMNRKFKISEPEVKNILDRKSIKF